jgi:hypothetical protein
MLIRITAVPPGEAPPEVRRAWVGLLLPLAPGEVGPRTMQTSGVLTGPRNLLVSLLHVLLGWTKQQSGYVVDAAQAVWLLGAEAPEAAAWWHENASHMLQQGRRFMFPSWCCREEPDSAARADRRSRPAPGPGEEGFQTPPAVRPD